MSRFLSVSSATQPALSRSQPSSPQPEKTIFSPQLQAHICQEVRVVADQSLDITGSFLGVVVGTEDHRENFFLHEKLFTSHSEFLKRAAKEEWLHQKNVILLPKDEPTTFRLYAVLTYTGVLTTRDLPCEWQSLVDVYVLAEKLQDSWAKNRIIDAMHSFVAEKLPRTPATANGNNQFSNCISAGSLMKLYNSTSTENQVRKFVVDLFADNGTGDWLAFARDLLPHDFFFEVAVRLLQKRPYVIFGNMLDRPSSHYHEEIQESKGIAGEDLEKATPKSEGSSPNNSASLLFGSKTVLTSNVGAVPALSVTV